MPIETAAEAVNAEPTPGPILRRVPVGALAVLAISGFASLLNSVWLSADRTPPHWDYANHLLSAFNYRAALANAASAGPLATLRKLVHLDVYVYPPFFPLTASLISPHLSLRSLVMTNCWFIAILAFSVYGIGRRLHSELAGVLSAALVVAYPVCAHLSRQFMVDFALLSLSAATAYFLIASEDFRVPWATWSFSITAALGMLTKPTFATFLVIPSLYVLIRALRRALAPDGDPVQRRGLIHLAGSMLVAGALVSVWYVPNWAGVRSEAVRIAASNPIGFRVFDASAIVYYLNVLMIDQIGLPFFALLVFGILVLPRRIPTPNAAFLLWWTFGLYVLASLSPYKGTGQDIGIVIPICLISAIGLAGLIRYRLLSIAAVLVFGAAQSIVISLPRQTLAARVGDFRWAGAYQDFPVREDWKIEEALRSLGSGVGTVAVLSDDSRINGNTLEFYRRSLGLPFRVFGRYDRSPDELLASDAFLIKTGSIPPGTTRGASLEGINTASLGVLYTPGRVDPSARPDEALANRLAQQDRELEPRVERLLAERHPSIRFRLPDRTELLVFTTSRPAR